MDGPDTRFVVANLKQRNARALYEDRYCRVDKPKITSSRGRRIWRRIAPPARRPRRISCGCSCTRVPLDHVGSACVDAQAFDTACRTIYVATAADQPGRARRRDEDDDPDASADIVPGTGASWAMRWRDSRASSRNGGATAPRTSNPSPSTRETLSPLHAGRWRVTKAVRQLPYR